MLSVRFHTFQDMYTLDQQQSRRSVRSFSTERMADTQRDAVREAISDINSHLAGLRFQFVNDDSTPFSGRFGGYGVFKNVNDYVAAVIDTGVANTSEIAGFAAQKVVMAAVTAGLGTCIVGGTYSSANLPVIIRAGEKVSFIIALGVPEERPRRFLEKIAHGLMHRKKMMAADFFDADKSGHSLADAVDLYPKLQEALEAVACAPSALNKRPVRIWIDSENDIHACVPSDAGFFPIDLGIAKFNFSQIIPGEWLWGNNARLLLD